MSQKLQSVRGTKDLFFEEAEKFRHVVDTAWKVSERFNFKEIQIPIFEFTEVFKRTLGETSDVVNKEMYTFEDKGGESITLRPEFTAGIARAFISNGLQQHLPLKLFSAGPLFRYERPQKGRQRQFHQVNFEYLGGKMGPHDDFMMILIALTVLRELGIAKKTKLHINSLGDEETRVSYTKALVSYFEKHAAKLSEDSKKRLTKNPMRILDSKDEADREILKNAPMLMEYQDNQYGLFQSKFYSESANNYFKNLICNLRVLENFKDNVVINPRLVRGLDYYSHTVFEFIAETDEMGAQNTVLAGGRYDGLIKTMGGPETSAVGFAAGVERLMLMMEKESKPHKMVSIISLSNDPIGEATRKGNYLLAYLLGTTTGFAMERIYEGENGIGKALQKANKNGSELAVIIGENEIKEEKIAFKNMRTGKEEKIPLQNIDRIVEYIKGKLFQS